MSKDVHYIETKSKAVQAVNSYAKGCVVVTILDLNIGSTRTKFVETSNFEKICSYKSPAALIRFVNANSIDLPRSRLPETSHQSDNVELVEVDGDTPSYLDRLNAVHCEIVDLMGHKAVASEVAHIIACDYPVDDDIPPCFRSAYPVNGLAEPCNLE